MPLDSFSQTIVRVPTKVDAAVGLVADIMANFLNENEGNVDTVQTNELPTSVQSEAREEHDKVQVLL